MPEELANITNKYNKVYENRHKRIEEKKVALLEQTKKPNNLNLKKFFNPQKNSNPKWQPK